MKIASGISILLVVCCTDPPGLAGAESQITTLETEAQRVSYAYGMDMAASFKRLLDDIGFDIDAATLLDGTEFASSERDGQPATLRVDRALRGWTEALQLMKVGSHYRIFLPPSLAFGAGARGRLIAPHATVIYELELLGVEPGKPGPEKSPDTEPRPESPSAGEKTVPLGAGRLGRLRVPGDRQGTAVDRGARAPRGRDHGGGEGIAGERPPRGAQVLVPLAGCQGRVTPGAADG